MEKKRRCVNMLCSRVSQVSQSVIITGSAYYIIFPVPGRKKKHTQPQKGRTTGVAEDQMIVAIVDECSFPFLIFFSLYIPRRELNW